MGAELGQIYRLLLDEYGEQGWWPVGGVYSRSFKKRARTPGERFEISVGAVLAQNTSWANVETALANLRGAGAMGR
jgi:endonuclease-3 related protein